MVVNWSPEPSKGADEGVFSLRDNPINLDLGESDDEMAWPSPNYGYLPIPLEPVPGLFDDDDDDDLDSDDPQPEEAVTPSDATTPTQETEERPNISVNDDEVRQIMSNVTLPSTSFPSWATDIPESQWTSYLMSRISRLQSESAPK